jgi:purine-cytosine permease-like protein
VHSSHLSKFSGAKEPETSRHNISFATVVMSNRRGHASLCARGNIIVVMGSELSYKRFISTGLISECMIYAENNYAE